MIKILNIIKRVLVWAVVLFAVLMMIFTVFSVATFNRNDRSVFGFKMYIVNSNSMAATDFDAGSLILVKEIDPSTLKEGDIITFVSQSSDNYGETVTHKIRKVTTDEDGDLAFVTYGTTTNTDDEALATVIIGQYVGRIPNLGAFFLFLKTTPGYIICILIPFLLLILSQGLNCIRLFRQYKKEQMDEMEAERAKLEEERAESQRIMAELLELKAQLAKKVGEESPPAPSASEGAPEGTATEPTVETQSDGVAPLESTDETQSGV